MKICSVSLSWISEFGGAWTAWFSLYKTKILRLAEVRTHSGRASSTCGSVWSMSHSAPHLDYSYPYTMMKGCFHLLFHSWSIFKTRPFEVQVIPGIYLLHFCQRNNKTKMEIQIFQCIIPSLSLIALEYISRAIRTWM